MAATTRTRKVGTAILAGPPASVSGFVPFHNPTAVEVTIDQVVIRDPDTGEATLPTEPIRVASGETVRVAVRLSLLPQTAPGAYPLEVTIAGTTTRAVAHVAEARDLALSPEALVVDNVAESSVTKSVVVANQGNVPLFVPDYGDVPLYREEAALITLLAIARGSALDVLTGIESLPKPDAVLRVATKGGRVTIPPGEIRAVELTVTVPPNLSHAARYLAALPVNTRTLLVAVVPGGARPSKRRRDRVAPERGNHGP